MDDFGSRLRTLRKEASITQTELAEKLNVHLQTVSKWERGLSEPDLSLFGELADILGVSLEKLVGAEEGETTFSGVFDAAAFGKNLAKLRKEKGESQEQLAELLAATASAVSKWERGIVCPDRAQLLLLAEHAGQPVSRLYYGIGERARTETPAQAMLRKRYTLLWAGLGALFCVALIVFSVFLPQIFSAGGGAVAAAEGERITVTVDGVEMTVDSDIWFGPQHVEREGYEFVGWEDTEGNALPVPMAQVPDGTEFCSVYRPIEFTLDYWLNGGVLPQGAPYTVTVESGAVQLPLPQKSGAVFEGWYLTPDYTGDPVTSVTCAAADILLYAKWSDIVYTVRYKLNGGALYMPNPETVTAGEEVALSEPLREGFNFLGWYDAPAGGERYETVGGANAKNLTLYALWQQCGDLFTILYETDGGVTDGQNPNSVGAGEWVSILFGATKTGYDFVGWNSKADGSGTWYTELYGIRSDLVLYAVYTPKIYTIVYELDDGTYYDGKENPNHIAYGDVVPLASVAKAGHTFRGWFDAETDGNQVTQIDKSNILRLHTLYARFEENVYTLVLDAAGGTFFWEGEQRAEHTLSLRYSDSFALPECTLAGYVFLGWFNADGERVAAIDKANIGSYTLTARYQDADNTYTVLYKLQGGIQAAGNPSEVVWGQVVYFADPSREGYRFLGWNDAADGSGEWYEHTPAGRQEDLTLYAIWQEITVSGSYKDFTYEKGQASVTVTGYTGAFGESIALTIPSYIDGLPVVAVEGDNYGNKSLYSLTIPATVERLGAYAFSGLNITQPVVIPAGVQAIGTGCFEGTTCSVRFEEGSKLRTLQKNAFSGATFKDILVLPHALTAIGVAAFSGSRLPGIVLPDTLTYIAARAFACWTGQTSEDLFRIYIPDSVEYIESFAFDGLGNRVVVYHSLSEETVAGFSPDWNASRNGVYPTIRSLPSDITGVTLSYDGKTEFLAGRAFALPQLQKEGYTFLGWQDEQGALAEPLYIPQREGVVLEAVFEACSSADGRSAAAPAVLELGTEYSVILPPNSAYYFTLAAGSGMVRLTVEDVTLHSEEVGQYVLEVQDLSGNSVVSGTSLSYTQGQVYTLTQSIGQWFPFRVKITAEAVPLA